MTALPCDRLSAGYWDYNTSGSGPTQPKWKLSLSEFADAPLPVATGPDSWRAFRACGDTDTLPWTPGVTNKRELNGYNTQNVEVYYFRLAVSEENLC